MGGHIVMKANEIKNRIVMPAVLLSAVLIVVSGCSFIPEYKRPDAPVEKKFSGSNTEESNQKPPLWSDYFGDADLEALIDLAMKNNRDVRIAAQNIVSMRAMYGIQKAAQLPTVSAGGSFNRSLTASSLSQTQDPLYATQYQVSLGISSWELDFWGRIESMKQMAQEAYFSTIQGQRSTYLSLVTQISQSYLLQSELEQRIQIAEGTLKIRSEGLRIARRRFEVGVGTKIDVTQTEILHNQALLELANLRKQSAQNMNALVLLVGTSFPSIKIKPLNEIEQYFQKEIPAGLPSDLILNRPDILSSEHMLKMANANIGAARAAYFPRISLTAGFGQVSSDLGNLFKGDEQLWNFSPSVNIPIFTGGRLDATLDKAKSQRDSAIATYEKTIQTAFKEVSDVLADKYWTHEQLKIQKNTLAAQTERSEIAQARYKKGSSSYFEVLDAERERFTVEQSIVQLRRSYLTTSVTLFSTLGGEYAVKEDTDKQPTKAE